MLFLPMAIITYRERVIHVVRVFELEGNSLTITGYRLGRRLAISRVDLSKVAGQPNETWIISPQVQVAAKYVVGFVVAALVGSATLLDKPWGLFVVEGALTGAALCLPTLVLRRFHYYRYRNQVDQVVFDLCDTTRDRVGFRAFHTALQRQLEANAASEPGRSDGPHGADLPPAP